jgi:hypothetical protein
MSVPTPGRRLAGGHGRYRRERKGGFQVAVMIVRRWNLIRWRAGEFPIRPAREIAITARRRETELLGARGREADERGGRRRG